MEKVRVNFSQGRKWRKENSLPTQTPETPVSSKPPLVKVLPNISLKFNWGTLRIGKKIVNMESYDNSTDHELLLDEFNFSSIIHDLGDGEENKKLRHSLGWTIVLICAYAIVFVVGIVGNVLVVLCITLKPQMKSVTNMFILNLAIADLMVILFCVAPTLLSNILISWVLGWFLCKAVAFVQGVAVCASVYSLVAISLDRFLAIWFPMKMPRGLTKAQARFIILFIWIVAASIASPWTFVFDLKEKDGHTYCLETWSSALGEKLFFIVGNLTLCYALPLALVILGNGLIWLHVAKRKIPNETASPADIKRVHRKTRHGVLKMLSAVTLTFLISWLPLYVIFTILKLGFKFPESLENMIPFSLALAQWLGAISSCVNPILYAFLNKKFRDSFRSLVVCPGGGGRRSGGRTTTTANGISTSLNNSTMSVSAHEYVGMTAMRQTNKRTKHRYPIVRV